MNTKLNNMKINPAFEELFSFGSKNERIEHNSQMISFRILSEVEKLCVEKKIKKKELAEMVGTSRSYITQLFRGTKQINTDIMARFEDVLNMHFEVKIKLNDEQRRLNWEVQPAVYLSNKSLYPISKSGMYYYEGGQHDKTNEIVTSLETENSLLQIA